MNRLDRIFEYYCFLNQKINSTLRFLLLNNWLILLIDWKCLVFELIFFCLLYWRIGDFFEGFIAYSNLNHRCLILFFRVFKKRARWNYWLWRAFNFWWDILFLRWVYGFLMQLIHFRENLSFVSGLLLFLKGVLRTFNRNTRN